MNLRNILLSILLFGLLFNQNLYSSRYYTIQLAVSKKSDDGFKYLDSEVEKLPPKLKKECRVVLGDKYYRLYAFITTSKYRVTKNLKEYREFFKDAYIREYSPDSFKVIKSYNSNSTLNNKHLPKDIKTSTDSRVNNNLKFTNEMLINHTIYALYIDSRDKKNLALIALELYNDFTLSFNVIIGKKQQGESSYFVDFQGRFYLYSDEESRYKDYYTLKKREKNYMEVESWKNGVKNSNRVLFFYSINHAKKYIDSLLSKT